MDYANIPDKILNNVIRNVNNSNRTLKNCLSTLREDIIVAKWKISKDCPDRLSAFTAWTKSFVTILVGAPSGGQILIYEDRDPPRSKMITKKARK